MGSKRMQIGVSLIVATSLAVFSSSSVNVQAAVNHSTNFASVASVDISTTGPFDSTFHKTELRYPATLISSSAWHGFYRQSGRDITVNLTYDRPIQKLSIEMEQNTRIGVLYPQHVDFQMNVGGQWYSLGSVQTKIPNTDRNVTTQVFSVSVNNLEGHLFRIHFPVGVWVFARNLQVVGNSFLLPGVQQLPNLPKAPSPFQSPLTVFDARDEGIRNMLLVYTGSYGTQGTWSTSDFVPMVTYVLQNGTVGGRMFDTMMFVPYADLVDTQTAWQSYINDLFSPNEQLSALDQAVGQTNIQMQRFGGNTGYKEKVILTIPYPKFGDGQWGSLNGQTISFSGTTSDPNATTARKLAMNWYVSTLLQAWQSANFQHLQLAGLYWQNESVNYTAPGELNVIQAGAGIAKAQNLPLYWLPYYDAPGLSDWQSEGFSAAWLQPNFIEQGQNADATRLTNAADLAATNGFGVEVEADSRMLSDGVYRALYTKELTQLEQDGMAGNVSHAFYAGSKILVDAANSNDSAIRAMYDQTYGFLTHS